MSEKTPSEVGREAADYYQRHADVDEKLGRVHAWSNKPEAEQGSLGQQAKSIIRLHEDDYNRHIDEATAFVQEHAADLHDLAVIEAHLDGVTVTVEEPLEIGQKVEHAIDSSVDSR